MKTKFILNVFSLICLSSLTFSRSIYETDELSVSSNGKCGEEDGICPYGTCCSKYGWCGTSDKHCGSGCQSEFGKCNSSTTTITATTTTPTTTIKPFYTISTNGRCGEKYGVCPGGECCSKYGWCGSTDNYCGSGCQSGFGDCDVVTTKKTVKKTTTTATPTTTIKPIYTISTDGRCGEKDGVCPNGTCCSKYGWCGSTSDYCGSGCQNKFGKCN